MTYSSEQDVFEIIPAEIRRPADVVIDGKGGVTASTFQSYQVRYKASIDAELLKAGLPIPTDDPPHELLNAAESHMVAGAIMRRFSSMQQQYTDAFASGNIFLRQYISLMQLSLGVAMGAPAFIIDVSPLPSRARDGFPDL